MGTSSTEQAGRANPQRFSLGGLFTAAFQLGLLCILGLVLLTFAGRLGWPIELLTHFRIQWAVVAAVAALFCLVIRKWRWALVPGLAFVLNGVELAPYYLAPSPPPAPAKTYRALFCNLDYTNSHHDRVIELVRTTQPDFIVVAELTSDWMPALEAIHGDYPHRVLPSMGEVGQMLLSGMYCKHPLEQARREKLTEDSRPAVLARVLLDGQPLQLVSPHPITPIKRATLEARDRELTALADLVATWPDTAVMVLGDLNASCFSPIITDVLHRSGLRDGRMGFGIQPSFPTANLPLRVPIDHCLVSSHLLIHQWQLGPEVGSDHFPVIVEFSFRPSK